MGELRFLLLAAEVAPCAGGGRISRAFCVDIAHPNGRDVGVGVHALDHVEGGLGMGTVGGDIHGG